MNIIRVALQGFAAVCGGTQSLHTNGFDEALALPTERSARIALRTQQVLAHESGAADTADPFAGSYFIESLTDEIEARAWELIDKVEQLGGSVEALEFIQREIEESAASYHERYRSGQDIIVGVNKYVTEEVDDVEILRVDPEAERRQVERLKRFKEGRDQAAVDGRLAELREVAAGRGQPALPDQGRAARPAPRSARSAARCARCSASTRAGRSSSRAWRRLTRPRIRCCNRLGSSREGVGCGWQKPGAMESKTQADAGQVRARAVGAGGRPRPDGGVDGRASWASRESVSVEVTHREPERVLAWRTAGTEAGHARIALELAEKGFGTSVSIVAQHSRRDRDGVDAALEQLLDELGSPVRRPFVGR